MAVFFCVVLVSLFLTVTGWTLFIGQMAAAGSVKDVLITLVVQAGLVVLGPLVLWAYLALIPKGLMTSILRRMAKPLGGA